MRNLWCFGLFLLLSVSVKADWVVVSQSGSQATAVSKVSCIRFENGQMITRYTDATTSTVAISNVKKCYFGTISGIQGVSEENTVLAGIFDGQLVPVGSLLQVSTLGGMLMINQTVTDGYVKPILDTLPKGVYIVRLNDQSIKIEKK